MRTVLTRRVLAEQPGQLLARRRLVVCDQYPQPGRGNHGWTPARYLGIRRLTLVPAPGAVSTTRPKSSP